MRAPKYNSKTEPSICTPLKPSFEIVLRAREMSLTWPGYGGVTHGIGKRQPCGSTMDCGDASANSDSRRVPKEGAAICYEGTYHEISTGSVRLLSDRLPVVALTAQLKRIHPK